MAKSIFAGSLHALDLPPSPRGAHPSPKDWKQIEGWAQFGSTLMSEVIAGGRVLRLDEVVRQPDTRDSRRGSV